MDEIRLLIGIITMVKALLEAFKVWLEIRKEKFSKKCRKSTPRRHG